jgi:hypothetical protein
MNAQLKKFGLGLAILAMPLLASSANAQWSQQATGVNVNLSDSQPAAAVSPDHTVSVDQYGTLNGRVASIDTSTKTANGLSGLNVFLVQSNQVIKQAQTQADGSFTIQGLNEGAYSFFAAGQNGVAAYGIYVTRQPGQTSNVLEATTCSAGYQGVKQLLQQNVPAVVAQSVSTALQSVQTTSVSTAKQIQLSNGRLHGQVSSVYSANQTVQSVQVYLIQNDQPIAQVQTDARGAFSIPDVAPGIYDFVAVGQNGFAATRFEAVGQSGPMTQVSYRQPLTQTMDVALTCNSCGGGQVAQPIDYAPSVAMEPAYSSSYAAPVEYAGESIAYGGASGGSCGCSGSYSNFGGGGVVRGRFGGGLRGGSALRGGAGAGGLGRVLFLGGIAGGVVAIADDDDAQDGTPNGG